MRVGVIGTGWGSMVHVPAYRLVDGYQVTALCARRPESVARAGDELGIADTSTDWPSFVRRADLDLISVASLVGQHHEMALAALGAGKHVVCEKPLAATADEAAAMTRAAERSGRVSAVCFETRWTEQRLAIRDAVRNGVLGRPYTVRLHESADYWHPSRPPQFEWMYRRDLGGGYLHGLMSHDLDFVFTLLGRPTAVCAEVHTSVPVLVRADGTELAVDADDSSAVLLRFASGAVAFLTCSVVGLGVRGFDFQAFGSQATITCSTIDGSRAFLNRPGAAPQPLAPSVRVPVSGRPLPARRAAREIRAMALLLEDLLPSVLGMPGPEAAAIPSFRDGWMVERVIEAAHASAGGAGWVPLED